MKMEEFREKVARLLQERLGEDVRVSPKDVTKNNGIILHGVGISECGKSVSPCIYLEPYLERVNDGEDIESLIDELVNAYGRSIDVIQFDANEFSDYGSVCKRIRARLVNTEKNSERLKGLPHREFLDLSLVYCVELSVGDGFGSITIENGHMAMWHVSEDELFSQAMSNMGEGDEASLQSLAEVLGSMAECFGETIPKDDFPMYVLTNHHKVNGASQIIRKDVLRHAGEVLGKDFMIIPSSIHEVLLVPDSGEPDLAKNIIGIIDYVNHTQVAEEEVLSSHVYRYCRANGEVTIAA